MCHTTFLFSQNGRFDILIEADCLPTFIRRLPTLFLKGLLVGNWGEQNSLFTYFV